MSKLKKPICPDCGARLIPSSVGSHTFCGNHNGASPTFKNVSAYDWSQKTVPAIDYTIPVTTQRNYRVVVTPNMRRFPHNDVDDEALVKQLRDLIFASVPGVLSVRVESDDATECDHCHEAWHAGEDGDNNCCIENARSYAVKLELDWGTRQGGVMDQNAEYFKVLDAWKRVADFNTAETKNK